MADEATKKSKRRVKNPETFRERALKASESSDKPKRAAKVAGTGSRVISAVLKPFRLTFGRLGKFLGKFRVFRFLGKILFPGYLRNSWRELRLVKWPSWKESRRLTFAVIIFATIFGASVAVVDYGLDKLFRNILLK
jgi:preprotein translocase SecE subunit